MTALNDALLRLWCLSPSASLQALWQRGRGHHGR